MNVHIFIIHYFIYLSILSSGFLISSEVNLLPPFKYSKNLPVPMATQEIGSSAVTQRIPVLSSTALSRPEISEPHQ